MPLIASLVCGLIFGLGLMISGMTDPTRVLGFLDVLGRWDPTLAFVMIGALAVTGVGFALVRRRGAPLLAGSASGPPRHVIDRPVVMGGVLFGTGWGLSGLCPGPALENLATLSPQVLVFVAAMALGMMLEKLWQTQLAPKLLRKRTAEGTAPDG